MSDANELISFIASMSGEGNLRVEENLGEGYVRLRVSEAERRQAKHDIQHVEDIVIEMLRNARDAGADKVYLATTKEDGVRTLVFLDNGSGVPQDMQERIFDARVTSKLESMKMDRWGVHGRGMALFSIKQNTDEARVVTSGVDLGSAFKVSVAADRLSERADQSSWPQAVKDDDGHYVCARGPTTSFAPPASLPSRNCAPVMSIWVLRPKSPRRCMRRLPVVSMRPVFCLLMTKPSFRWSIDWGLHRMPRTLSVFVRVLALRCPSVRPIVSWLGRLSPFAA